MSKEQDNMMKKALAKALNCNLSQIKDFRGDKEKSKRKTKKEKKLMISDEQVFIDSGEGLVLTNNGTKYIDFTDIKRSGIFSQDKKIKHIFDWDKPRDFVTFVFDLYKKKFKTELNLKLAFSCNEINRIRDDLYDLTNISAPLVTKDYILFCFDTFVPDIVKKQNKFYFSHLRNKYHMVSFANSYNYRESLRKEFDRLRSSKQEISKKYFLQQEEIKQGYSLSKISFLCDYGIIISVNWLIVVKGRDFDEAVNEVVDICLKIKEEGAIQVLQEATEKFSPYPSSLEFKRNDFNSLIEKIDVNLHFNISFSKSEDVMSEFNFIMKGENGQIQS